MRDVDVVSAFAIVLLSGCAAPHSLIQTSQNAQADRLEYEVRDLAQLGTGASITVRHGDVERTFTAGTSCADAPVVTASTRFNVGSVSKLLTAAHIVSLAHEGTLDLASSVHDFLPGVVLVDDDGVEHGDVTIDMLLRHRAGLPHQPHDLDPARIASSWQDPNLLAKLTESWRIALVATPGTYRYSNMGYALLGAIVARTSGETYADAMAAFLRTVAMPTATFSPTEAMPDAACGVVANGDARAFQNPSWYSSSYAMPFTGLWTSTNELARFGQNLGRAAADRTSPLHAMTEGAPHEHGRGPIHGSIDGLATLEHDGGTPGFLALLVVVPSRDLSIAIACNGNGEDPAVLARFRPLVRNVIADALRN